MPIGLRDNAGKPARKIGPLRAEVIGPPACPIMHRWTLLKVRGRKMLLHHFLPNADDRAEHDHPASFWTFVLWGGYDDFVQCPRCEGTRLAEDRLQPEIGSVDWAPGPDGQLRQVVGSGVWSRRPWSEPVCARCGGRGNVPGDRMRAGTLRHREATYRHRTRVLSSGAWTIVWMGRKERPWGFWQDGRWWPWRQYERAFGFGMRCSDDARESGQ